MGNSVRLRALALVTTGILGTWGSGGAAAADPQPDHADHGQHAGQQSGQGQGQGQGSDKGDRPKGDHGQHHGQHQGQHQGHAHAPGQVANPGHQGGQHGQSGQAHGQSGQAHGQGAGHGDPAGNNGTVKIAGPGDEVGHPSNDPHPGCTFVVEWFGFDQGADVVSTVTFASQAPTADVVLGGTSPTQVFVGGDAAGGGTDLDGSQAYTLTFQGEPHPRQGYHVKLTVATPHSLGNDTKTKVFWVEPCATTAPDATGDAAPGATSDTPDDEAGAGVASSTVDGAEAAGSADRGVLGETFTAASADDAAAAVGSAAVPTAVDAGENSALPAWARSSLSLTLVSLALVLAGVGIVLRNQSRA